jgi:hypothetical protein
MKLNYNQIQILKDCIKDIQLECLDTGDSLDRFFALGRILDRAKAASDILNKGKYECGHPYKTKFAQFPKKIAVVTPYEFWYRVHCKNIIDNLEKYYKTSIQISTDNRRQLGFKDGTSIYWFTKNSLDIDIRGHRFDEINVYDTELSKYQWELIHQTLL